LAKSGLVCIIKVKRKRRGPNKVLGGNAEAFDRNWKDRKREPS